MYFLQNQHNSVKHFCSKDAFFKCEKIRLIPNFDFSDRITTFLKDFTFNNYRVTIILRKKYLLNKNLLPNTLDMTAVQVSHYEIKEHIRELR